MIPAIDLRCGRVVRLERGAFDRETVFGEDPVAQARAFATAGARWIHVVDLDGARAGERRQDAAIRSVIEGLAGRASVQVAGGLRDAASIDAAVALGAGRIVLGTAAITDPEVVRDAVERHGAERIAVAVDVRDGLAVGAGWVDGAPARAVDQVVDELTGIGIGALVVTAIVRDGLLGGPDLELLARCLARTTAPVIASGGIRSVDDLRAARAIGCRGAIVGRALYDGRLELSPALRDLAADNER